MPKYQKVVKQYKTYDEFTEMLYVNRIDAVNLLEAMDKAPQSVYCWRNKGVVPLAVYELAEKTAIEFKKMLAEQLKEVDYSNQTARRKHSIMQSCVDKVVSQLKEQNKKKIEQN